MNGDFLLDSLEHIDADLIEDAAQPPRRRPARWGWIAAAACLCVLIGGALLWPKTAGSPQETIAAQPEPMTGPELDADDAQQWSQTLSAADYFKNNTNAPETPSESASLVMPPYAAAFPLNDERAALEAENVLPEMPEHPEQSFLAEYSGDGSLYKVYFHWMRRDEEGLENYSDLILAAAPEQRNELDDCIVYERKAPVTATLRDGILITAEGCEGREKTLTWQTDGGWYRISGSWNDSFEDVVALLDWFWAHPLELQRFAAAPEGTLRSADRGEYPDAFRGQIPDFAALGYAADSERLNLSGDTPVWFAGVYARGETRVHWELSTGADKDAWDACLGRPAEVTREALAAALEKDYVNLFLEAERPCMATLRLGSGTPDDAWEIIQTLVN